MSWLNNLRPRLKFLKKKDTPDNLWVKCKGCGQMIFEKDLKQNLSVCPECDHHERIGPAERMEQLFDGGDFSRLPTPKVADDPLKFKDQKPYPVRLKAARAATGDQDAFVLARGRIGGTDCVVGVQNFAYMGGSMGMGVGAAFVAGARVALKEGLALYRLHRIGRRAHAGRAVQPDADAARNGGDRGTERGGLPYIVVLTDPTTGGVTASYAMLGDVQISEPRALIGLAGQRVIEQTIREKLPEGFQRAEFLLEHGMIDKVVHRKDLAATLGRIVGMMMGRDRRQQAATG